MVRDHRSLPRPEAHFVDHPSNRSTGLVNHPRVSSARSTLVLQITRTLLIAAILGLLLASGIAHSFNTTVNHTSMTDSHSQAAPADSSPDLILTNGDIFSGDPSRPRVQALAARGELIVATGSNDEIALLQDS